MINVKFVNKCLASQITLLILRYKLQTKNKVMENNWNLKNYLEGYKMGIITEEHLHHKIENLLIEVAIKALGDTTKFIRGEIKEQTDIKSYIKNFLNKEFEK